MKEIATYTDQEIVKAILDRDTFVTKEYLYKKCYPLFSAVYNRYYTDCGNVLEFINEIYIYIIVPQKKTGRNKLSDFGYRCSLTSWLKIVAENFCHHLFTKKLASSENISLDDDRNIWKDYSLELDMEAFNAEDIRRILQMMPNERYRQLIEYRYLDDMSNEETALQLSLSMANYYNVHLRAKAQFCSALKKEGLI